MRWRRSWVGEVLIFLYRKIYWKEKGSVYGVEYELRIGEWSKEGD
jgi:hypothetical protein